MNDIVERLRQSHIHSAQLNEDAAAEIETLRADNAGLKLSHDRQYREARSLRAKIQDATDAALALPDDIRRQRVLDALSGRLP